MAVGEIYFHIDINNASRQAVSRITSASQCILTQCLQNWSVNVTNDHLHTQVSSQLYNHHSRSPGELPGMDEESLDYVDCFVLANTPSKRLPDDLILRNRTIDDNDILGLNPVWYSLADHSLCYSQSSLDVIL